MFNRAQQRESHHLIAIIDDEQSVRSALVNLLHSAGYRTCSFASAEAFLASDRLRAATCAIMDVRLKTMSGLELQERLTGLQIALPAIFISGHSSRAEQERVARLGAVAFLSKPIDADTLLSHIRRVTLAGEQP